jgi:hypothetical protein
MFLIMGKFYINALYFKLQIFCEIIFVFWKASFILLSFCNWKYSGMMNVKGLSEQ